MKLWFMCSQYVPKASAISQQIPARTVAGSNSHYGDGASSHRKADKVLNHQKSTCTVAQLAFVFFSISMHLCKTISCK